jgi:mannosylglycerate hydrolase
MPLEGDFLPQRHLVIVPHTHWDREWYRTHEEFRFRLVRLLDGVLGLLERDPDFRHFTLDGQTIVLDDYLEVRPHARDRIEKLVRAGRLLIGPWHVLPDEWLVSGEALIRNLRHGIARAADFGGSMPVGYVPDQFGHVGQMPQIFAGFGFEAAALWRGVGENVDRTSFVWQAPDGTELFTVFLVRGYGNAANLPLAPEALAARLLNEASELQAISPTRSVLLMNGSDHLEPQPALPAALAAAAGDLEGASFEIGTLPTFVELARAEALPDPVVHRGELRSGLRSPLLEGCASARMPQKRRDFENDRLLTRYLEPLAAWLAALGGDPDTDRIRFAWGIALENHPHDSICGCSVDAVHDQMDVRFTRTAEVAGAHLAQVSHALAQHVAFPSADSSAHAEALLAWNPNAAGVAQVEGELLLDLPARSRKPRALHLRGRGDERIPVHAECIDPGRSYAEYRVPANVAVMLLGGFPPEFFGEYASALRVGSHRGEAVADLLMCDDVPVDFDWPAIRSAAMAELEALGEIEVWCRIRRLPRFRVRFVDAVPGWGLRAYRLMRGCAERSRDASTLVAESTGDGGVRIGNGIWRIEAGADGRVCWLDERSGVETRDALRLVSEGDRGDSYNFDPVPAAPAIERPSRVKVRMLPPSEAEVGLALELDYRLPEGLVADRSDRASRLVPLRARVELRLARCLDRIDIAMTLDNRARDHRMRVHLRTPFSASRFEVESAFEIAQRPIAPAPDSFGADPPAEIPIGAVPQRAFATIDDGESAMTVANRGCSEVEAVEEADGTTSLALTLLRAFGWLSRADLATRPAPAGPPFETPGGQARGVHRVECSVRSHAAGAPDRVAEAHRYVFSAIAFEGSDSTTGRLADGDRLIEVDDPAVVVSAFEPAPEGGAIARLVNLSSDPRSVGVRAHAAGFHRIERVDLKGDAIPGLESAPADAAEQALGPWQIASIRLD